MHEAESSEGEAPAVRRSGKKTRAGEAAAVAAESAEQTLDGAGRGLLGWEGARLSEGELWLATSWTDGTTDWLRAQSIRGTEYAPQLLEYYEGLFEEITN